MSDEGNAEFKQPQSAVEIEKQQEQMLKNRYGNLKPKAGSSMLQKRMKEKKWFDSGDYNMARAQMNTQRVVPESKQLNQVTGDHMPTPDELPRVRKPSQSNLVISHSS